MPNWLHTDNYIEKPKLGGRIWSNNEPLFTTHVDHFLGHHLLGVDPIPVYCNLPHIFVTYKLSRCGLLGEVWDPPSTSLDRARGSAGVPIVIFK